jgi:hypothetical protein
MIVNNESFAGQAKPSKTGITLNKEEWENMLAVQNEVEFQ